MAQKKYEKYQEYEFATGKFFQCYFRSYGANYEVGLMYAGKTIFFGNFISKAEAMLWFKQMTKEMSYFLKKYEYMPNMKMTWYMNFAKNYFYAAYYRFLDQAFSKYTRTYQKAYSSDMKTYKKYETQYEHSA